MRSPRRPLPALVAAAALACGALLSACGSSTSAGASSAGTSPAGTSPAAVSGKVTVLAAASLTGAFTRLGTAFEAAHPGTTVVFSFGASSTLATQITQGAPADVFASASVKTMDQVVAAGAATAPRTFARNVMQIAVPPANPAGVATLADLARPGVKVVLCAEAVPCGATARTALANAGVTVRPVSDEADVKATLAKVQLGEADAGIVYVTDVLAAGGKVTGIPIPADVNASTSYPLAVLGRSANPAAAQAFADYVLSADGAAALAESGFEKP